MEHSDLWCELHLQKRSVIWSNDQSAFVSEATGRQYRLSVLLSSNSPTKFPEGIMNVATTWSNLNFIPSGMHSSNVTVVESYKDLFFVSAKQRHSEYLATSLWNKILKRYITAYG